MIGRERSVLRACAIFSCLTAALALNYCANTHGQPGTHARVRAHTLRHSLMPAALGGHCNVQLVIRVCVCVGSIAD